MKNHESQKWIKNVSRRVAEIRVQKGLTQAQVAEKIGITQRSYQVWENGTKEMKIGTLYKLSLALGCNPADFLKKAKSPAPKPGRPRQKMKNGG
jgi:transcriptional regulator with XRE-family HTH domain